MVVAAIFIILITILIPPIGVWMVAGCGADLLINICLTILGVAAQCRGEAYRVLTHGDMVFFVYLSTLSLTSPTPTSSSHNPAKEQGNNRTKERGLTCMVSTYSYLPGHIHAFYLEYVYFDRREQAREGRINTRHAPGVYSSRVQSGGHQGYGTINQGPPVHS
ncbi:Plasma membrane proteolipid 3 [Zalerion maritima]|uniref:Plasma membrane proteolipid 3 n=1 Tax=Zalerion maritima TaxID=339359 RepID=A0AAD5RG75_9PEZI|nr:Plasma membrane proteolipid 3 [Zalerion maritima]